MILFFHGYGSSSTTTKFLAIKEGEKVCYDVDYDALTYEQTFNFYAELVQRIKPDILAGHSLGGYWALLMGAKYRIPAAIINPELMPFLYENKNLIEPDEQGVYRLNIEPLELCSYIESGDEIINVPAHISALSKYYLTVYEGGHHRIENLNAINDLIETIRYNGFLI